MKLAKYLQRKDRRMEINDATLSIVGPRNILLISHKAADKNIMLLEHFKLWNPRCVLITEYKVWYQVVKHNYIYWAI